jgi:uncharacterized protein (DUF488 family)
MTVIYTIGHSDHKREVFLELLRQHGIRILVDVRSSPYSRYVPQANRETLARTLQGAGIIYRWLGDRLGGKPGGAIVDYDELRASPDFQEAVTDLLSFAVEERTAIMCAEGDHRQCHRYKLITPALLDQGVQVLHIQPDGAIVDEDKAPRQLTLF